MSTPKFADTVDAAMSDGGAQSMKITLYVFGGLFAVSAIARVVLGLIAHQKDQDALYEAWRVHTSGEDADDAEPMTADKENAIDALHSKSTHRLARAIVTLLLVVAVAVEMWVSGGTKPVWMAVLLAMLALYGMSNVGATCSLVEYARDYVNNWRRWSTADSIVLEEAAADLLVDAAADVDTTTQAYQKASKDEKAKMEQDKDAAWVAFVHAAGVSFDSEEGYDKLRAAVTQSDLKPANSAGAHADLETLRRYAALVHSSKDIAPIVMKQLHCSSGVELGNDTHPRGMLRFATNALHGLEIVSLGVYMSLYFSVLITRSA